MGDDSSLPEPFARRLARVDIPVLTSGRGRETSPGRSLYGWAKFRLRTFSKNPPNSRTKGAECGLTVRDGGNNPQRPLLAERATRHVQRKHPLEQLCPTPARRLCVGCFVRHPLLPWRGDDGLAQVAVWRQTAA